MIEPRDGIRLARTIVRRGTLGKPTPTAADLQYIRLALFEFGQDALILVLLGAVQFVGAVIQRRGIGHALVQPQRIEVVAQVVVGVNVLLRPRTGIGAQGVRQAPIRAAT